MTQTLAPQPPTAGAAEGKKRLIRSALAAEEAVIELARKDAATFCAYVLRDEKTGKRIVPAPYHERWHRDLDEHPNLVIWSHVEAGKGLPLDTPIPSPRGWTTMGDLCNGDVIYGGAGEETTVTFVTGTHTGLPCYRVRFDDGAELVTDNVHRWKVWNLLGGGGWSVRSTESLLTSGICARCPDKHFRYKWAIPGVPPIGGVSLGRLRTIVSIAQVDSVPTRCITVDSADHTYVAGRDRVVTHNTWQMTIGRCLWELGNDHKLRNVIVSATAGFSVKILKRIAVYIEHSAELHRVFPHLKKGDPWLPGSGQISIRGGSGKDPSVQSTGYHGNVIGSRVDRLYMDDILRHENVRTEKAREEVIDWYSSTLSGRLVEGARVRWIGQAWHPKDAMHYFEKAGWPSKRYPVIDNKGNLAWPERWSKARIDAWRKTNPSHVEYMRQLLCIARDDAESRFRIEWIQACKERGEGLSLIHSLSDDILDDDRLTALDTERRLSEDNGEVAVFTGVDLAVQRHGDADKTCFFTAMLHPNGDRQILNIESGRWSAMEIIKRAVDVYKRFGAILIVENNAAQHYIVDLLRNLNVTLPVRAFTTGHNKAHIEFGVESLGAELEGGRWIIPNDNGRCDPEVDSWIQGLLSYQPDAHTSDHVMACVPPGHLVTTARGLVPIEAVVAGDQVLTHRSRWRRVTGTEVRNHKGDLVEVKPRGEHPLLLTPDHHVWRADAKFVRDGTNRLAPKTWDWAPAADLSVGRKTLGQYVLAPAAAWPGQAPAVGPDEAFLAGLYLAEGSVSDHQAVWSFHERETYLHDFVAKQAAALYGARTSVYQYNDRASHVTVLSKKAAEYYRAWGKRADKHLPWDWMALPVDLGLHVVMGWLVGDGNLSRDSGGRVSFCGVSVSRAILAQMQQFLRRAGMCPNLTHFPQSGYFNGKPCSVLPAWRLSLSESDSARLFSATRRLEVDARWVGYQPRPPRAVTNGGSTPVPGGTAVRLAQKRTYAYDGPVHNLHVEEDESFVVEGIAVHNCWFAREGMRLFERRRIGDGGGVGFHSL